VENWVRPFGHAGEQMFPSEEEIQAAHEKAVAESKAWQKTVAELEAERKESIEAAVNTTATDISEEVEVVEVLPDDPYANMTKEELKAELEKRG
jgi:hypothetical protein